MRKGGPVTALALIHDSNRADMLHTDPFTRHECFTLWRLNPHPSDPAKPPVKVPVHYDGRTHHSLGNARKGIPPNPAPPLTAALAEKWLAHNRAAGVGHDRPGEVGYLGVGFRPAGTGLACLDIDDCIVAGAWSALALEMMARFPGALLEVSTSGTGLHIWFSYSGASPGRNGKDPTGQLELYAEGQFIAAGQILQGSAAVDHTGEMRAVLAQYWPPRANGVRGVTANDWAEKTDEQRASAWADLRSALSVISADDRDTWIAVGQALVSLGDEGFDLWDEWSATSDQYQGRDDLEGRNVTGNATDYRAIFARAERGGWVNPKRTSARIEVAMAGFGVGLVEGGAAHALRVGTNLPENITPAGAATSSVAINTIAPQHAAHPPQNPVADSTVAASVAINNIANTGGAGAQPAPYVPPTDYGAPPASPATNAMTTGTFAAASEGLIAATLPNIIDALSSAESGVAIHRDDFTASLRLSDGQTSRTWEDEDYTMLRCEMERRGFKSIGPELIKSSVKFLARQRRMDSAIDWADGLVWDGVPRVAEALTRYYRTVDTPYTRAVAEYLFTALAGRCLQPGCQADMAIILVGVQGAGKTTAVRALAPTHDAFVSVNLAARDTDLSRRLRGKLVGELGELRGLSSKDREDVKEWLTRCEESWVEKYETHETVFRRRCIFIGTTNQDEFLDDDSGERRWLPVRVGVVDVAGLERDRDQLWAEGIAMWRAGGIRWQEAQRLATNEHGQYKVTDSWQGDIERWLAAPPVLAQGETDTGRARGLDPVSTRDILHLCLRIAVGMVDRRAELRVAKIMRSLNYINSVTRFNGHRGKYWRLPG